MTVNFFPFASLLGSDTSFPASLVTVSEVDSSYSPSRLSPIPLKLHCSSAELLLVLHFREMHAPILPPSLLDLISIRASSSLRQSSRHQIRSSNLLGGVSCSRSVHQAALATVPPPDDLGHFDQAYRRSVRSSWSLLYPNIDIRNRRRVVRRREGALAVRPSHHGGPSKSLSMLEEKVQALQSTAVNEVLT